MLYTNLVHNILKYNNISDLSKTLLVSKDFNNQTNRLIDDNMIDTSFTRIFNKDTILMTKVHNHVQTELSIVGNWFVKLTLEDSEVIYMVQQSREFGRIQETSLFMKSDPIVFDTNVLFAKIVPSVSNFPNIDNLADDETYEIVCNPGYIHLSYYCDDKHVPHGADYVRITHDYEYDPEQDSLNVDNQIFYSSGNNSDSYNIILDMHNGLIYNVQSEVLKKIASVERIL